MTLISKSVVLAVLLMTMFVSSDIISIDTNEKNIYGAAKNDDDDGDNSENGKNGDQNDGQDVQNRANGNSKKGKGKKWGLELGWQQFKDSFGLSFTEGAEDDEKRKNWEESVKELKNSQCQENCGVNPTFIKSKEQKNNMLGLLVGKPDFSKTDYKYYDNPDGFQLSESGTPSVGAPTSIDWRNYGIVTTVKDQGQCGSCWAFAATGFLESQYIKRNKVSNTLNLAEHFLNQCDTKSLGCNGGNPFSAAALGVSKGMPSEARMPYKIGYNYPATYCTSPVVSAKFTKSGQVVSTYSSTNNQRDAGIISYLQYRPVIIALYASEWYNYFPSSTLTISQKVFSCSYAASVTYGVNHAVLLVGFTSTYWIIKNSWGAGWGDKGYIYINRDPNKNCGIGKWYGSLSTTV